MFMNVGEFVILLGFLAVLLIVPMVIIQLVGRRRSISSPRLCECPNCGAENHASKKQCYCCGHRLDGSPTAGMNIPVMKRVKQADEEKLRQKTSSKPAESIQQSSLQGDQAIRE